MCWLLQVPKIQDGSQNGSRFYILIIISQPYILKTQVRYPNICFEVWTIYLKHYYNVLVFCKYPKSKMAAVWRPRWRPKRPSFLYFNPHLTKLFFVTRLTRGVVATPSLVLVPIGRYGPSLFIHTKWVQLAKALRSYDVIKTCRTWKLQFFCEKYAKIQNFAIKSSEYQNFTGFFAYTKGKW